MNIAVIFAGGTGQRMKAKTKPKQFLELHGKPILVYTIEHFQRHKAIDGVVLVILESWIEYCQELIETFRLTKVKAVVKGGATGQESIYNGLSEVERLYGKENVTVLIHDGVRPLIDEQTITNALDCVKLHGNAITVTSAIETVSMTDENGKIVNIMERSQCFMARAPQCFRLSELIDSHRKAIEEKKEFIDSASMMRYYGYELYTVEGAIENIKITTPSDFYIFRAIVDAREGSQIFG
ncbi:2-C-methyl-D-erythritol 4-phosphate cytidylyltransferase [Ruminococcus sp.]|jgi:2-C-methyl-D-erythritol 4-phosphate cytidylyltransferase|uniref:2-C-methyl-D-erythritol 4-phosphate cytidylyltransferase n=1 Tax=Ruminococcus sp. TaxID=41978 RepID=UPI002600503A|nr:2-C-methyl-D-erythritol 4-phosphate cytidylyltransferase [Ruminococcus sp.]